jgi:hypothetical protein
MLDATGAQVEPDDLARAVDALSKGAAGARGIVDGGVDAAAVKEAVNFTAAINVDPDDLARIVDAELPVLSS